MILKTEMMSAATCVVFGRFVGAHVFAVCVRTVRTQLFTPRVLATHTNAHSVHATHSYTRTRTSYVLVRTYSYDKLY